MAKALAERTMSLHDQKLLAKEIAAYLLQEGLVNDLEPILRDVMAIRAEQGYVEADALSAHPLSEADVADIKNMLKDIYPDVKNLKVSTEIDESVVGGVKLVMPKQQLDETVRAQISKFKYLTSERT